ncbi:MAG: Cof-type HAD-IIB family hydrolase [Solobacterium sp.]|nr:Cof-type HAD-IIB family hydrolase [Solobacterium sp.]
MIKAILLDIDGTLTDDRKRITPETKKALLKAQAAGIRLIIASGRPPRGLRRFAEELDMYDNRGLFICYNGAEVITCGTEETLFSVPMRPEESKAVLQHLKQFDVVPVIMHGRYAYLPNAYKGNMIDNGKGTVFNVIDYEVHSNGYLIRECADMAEEIGFPVKKILTAGDPAYLKEHYMEMDEPFRDTLSCMFTAPFYYEFTAKGIDKAKAIEATLKHIGCTREELMAFGDAQNDRSMIAYAGIGVAMGNAVDEVKEAAGYVTLDNNHDGIAHALHHFLGI